MLARRSSLVGVAVLSILCSSPLIAATISIQNPADDGEIIEGSGFGTINGACSESNVTVKVTISNTYTTPQNVEVTVSRSWNTQTSPLGGGWSTSDPGTPQISLEEGTWKVEVEIVGDPDTNDMHDGVVTSSGT